VKRIQSLLVINEVLHAAQTSSHSADRLVDCALDVDDVVGRVPLRSILGIWRVWKTSHGLAKHTEVFIYAMRIAKRLLMDHAKCVNHRIVLIAIGESSPAHIVVVHEAGHQLGPRLRLLIVTHFQLR
jgi:hypothetical protein